LSVFVFEYKHIDHQSCSSFPW